MLFHAISWVRPEAWRWFIYGSSSEQEKDFSFKERLAISLGKVNEQRLIPIDWWGILSVSLFHNLFSSRSSTLSSRSFHFLSCHCIFLNRYVGFSDWKRWRKLTSQPAARTSASSSNSDTFFFFMPLRVRLVEFSACTSVPLYSATLLIDGLGLGIRISFVKHKI